VKTYSDFFNLLFLSKPLEICQRMTLLALQGENYLNLDEDSMYILLKGDIKISKYDDST